MFIVLWWLVEVGPCGPVVGVAPRAGPRPSGGQESVDAFAGEPVAAEVAFKVEAVLAGEGDQLFGGLASFLEGVGDGAGENESVGVEGESHGWCGGCR